MGPGAEPRPSISSQNELSRVIGFEERRRKAD
jgi:hypothetical protein